MSLAEEQVASEKRRRSAKLERYYVTGAAAIGRELGCSAATVRRMVAAGRLTVFRTGTMSNTSPIRAMRSEIERIRRGQMQERRQ